jgi:hypothetical protein
MGLLALLVVIGLIHRTTRLKTKPSGPGYERPR